MIYTFTIKKDVSQEPDKNFKPKVKITSSPFRYNTQYSNLAVEAMTKPKQPELTSNSDAYELF